MSEMKKNLVTAFTEMKDTITNVEARLNKFVENDNKSAGTDVRKAMQEIKMYAQNIRTLVQDIKNAE